MNIPVSFNETAFNEHNVNKYFNSLIWNINLYNGNVIPNYIPNYSINISTLLKYFPKKIKRNYQIPKWQSSDVYLLLLMPSVGKDLLPDNLKKFMDKKSPIKDLFPEPCNDCIQFKNKISSFNNETDSNLIRCTNEEYKNHIEENHKLIDLPLKRISEAINNNL